MPSVQGDWGPISHHQVLPKEQKRYKTATTAKPNGLKRELLFCMQKSAEDMNTPRLNSLPKAA